MANERTLMNVTIIEPESPPKVGGGNRVAESSSPQQHAEDSDGTALNPNGSAIPDDEQQVPTLIKPKKTTKVSTFNFQHPNSQRRLAHQRANL